MSVRKILHNRRKRHDPNYVPVKLETRKRVRLFVEEGAGWQGTDEEVQTLRKFYQITFRDNPPDFTNCGKCFLRCCKRMLEYWKEENRKKWED
jgi:hypothetical protein